MQSINFDNGYKRYSVNGDESNFITVNISDLNIAKRYSEAIPKLTQLSDKYKSVKLTEENSADIISELDTEVRKLIDGIFNSDISSHVFGAVHPLTMLVSGKILAESFLEAFMPIVKNDMEEIAKSAAKRADKYVVRNISDMPYDERKELYQ